MSVKQYWKGKSGVVYEFDVYPIGQEFRPVSGVYIFCIPIGDGRFRALYVGETKSFNDRLNTGLVNHDGYKRARAFKATHVAARVVASANRLIVETDLRHGLNPVCNRQAVPSLLSTVR
jgi:hypothetical protein